MNTLNVSLPLAREMAATETRESRRDELLAMAENCDLIAHQPPQTFWQALQLCYFIQLIFADRI